MQAFRQLDSVIVPIARANVDTDQIMPARYLQKPRVNNFGAYLFRDLRLDRSGAPNADFVLNLPAYAAGQIVVAGANFGCGSSREHAVWALCDHGIRAVVAPSFGDIFYTNALKNGLLPIVLPPEAVQQMIDAALATPGARAQIDLEATRLTAPDSSTHDFQIDQRSRHCLLNGIDEIDFTLTKLDLIKAFEGRHEIAETAGQ